MGHVTQRAGKHFKLSRQTLHHMAFTRGAVLAFDRDEVKDRVRYPHGGLVFVPDEEALEGMQVSPTFKYTLISYCLKSYVCLKPCVQKLAGSHGNMLMSLSGVLLFYPC
jgi:hypothetical protein